MTPRDRIVLMVVGALVVLAAAYMLVLSPEKKRASEMQAKVETARTQLSEAQSKLAEAQQAERRYTAAYASIVSLGEAVPADREVPSLVYELDHASSKDSVNFEAIAAGGSGPGSSGSATESTASVASGGFQQLPFTFSFKGSFEQLYKLIGRLQGFTVSSPSGSVTVSGRLLSIQGVTLSVAAGEAASSAGGGSTAASNELTAAVTATAYVLPAGESLTGGASAAAPSGASPASSGSSSSSGSGATPAIVRPLR
jgi:Tfp pilus assembly protein PilO